MSENVLRNAMRLSPNGSVVELSAERSGEQLVLRAIAIQRATASALPSRPAQCH